MRRARLASVPAPLRQISTQGRHAVRDVRSVAGLDADDLLRRVAATQQGSDHPLAQAIVRTAEERGMARPASQDCR